MKTNYEIYAYQLAIMNSLEKKGLLTNLEKEKLKAHIKKKYMVLGNIKNYE